MTTRKRGNGEGSIYRRKDGRWCGQYMVYTAKGPKYRYIYGKTRREVDEKLTKAKAERDGGLVFDAGTARLSEYLDRWLTDAVRDTVGQRTFERYEQIVRTHLTPSLGGIKLKSISRSRARALPLEAELGSRSSHCTIHTYDSTQGAKAGCA
jgi:hypothetical protein